MRRRARRPPSRTCRCSPTVSAPSSCHFGAKSAGLSHPMWQIWDANTPFVLLGVCYCEFRTESPFFLVYLCRHCAGDSRGNRLCCVIATKPILGGKALFCSTVWARPPIFHHCSSFAARTFPIYHPQQRRFRGKIPVLHGCGLAVWG